MDSTGSGTPSSEERVGAKEARRARQQSERERSKDRKRGGQPGHQGNGPQRDPDPGDQLSDQHGTATLTVGPALTAAQATWREFTPYGAPRGTTVTWIDNRGFLDKPQDAGSGPTDVGARWYDLPVAVITTVRSQVMCPCWFTTTVAKPRGLRGRRDTYCRA
jgi:hypothetical protein